MGRSSDAESAGKTHVDESELAEHFGLAMPIARLLIQRGFRTLEDTDRFLNANDQDLHDPFLLPDMKRAVTRILHALDTGETIGIYGDYDVDGVTSAALLTRVLQSLSGHPENIITRVPHRCRDGYGVTPNTLQQFLDDGATLVISTDCGITCHEAAAYARHNGLDFIITDHHEPGDTLPDAFAVVNPKVPGSQYPFHGLAGVGVAFKVGEALALERGINVGRYRPRFLDLVALGTVADNAPLVDENRAMVRMGLAALASTRKVGLRALLQMAGAARRPVNSATISFHIAPRLNAVGRMDDADIALRLLLTSDTGKAHNLAESLEDLNDQRRREQDRILQEAQEFIMANRIATDRVLVVYGKNWHQGVVGIVAGRLADQYHRPAMVVATDGVSGRGSARSAGDFPVLDALRACDSLLSGYGGHSQAAGFELDEANLPQLRERLNDFAADIVPEEAGRSPLDAFTEILPHEICAHTLAGMALLEPFGAGNPEPVWMARDLELAQARAFGKHGEKPHLGLRLQADEMAPVEGVWWRRADRLTRLPAHHTYDITFRLEANHFGNAPLRLNVRDMKPSGLTGDSGFSDSAPDAPFAD